MPSIRSRLLNRFLPKDRMSVDHRGFPAHVFQIMPLVTFLNEWDSHMAASANRLKIKYGLGENPTDRQIQLWVMEVRSLIAAGYRPEQAGELAAERNFQGVHTHVYASEADTIEMLLNQATDK